MLYTEIYKAIFIERPNRFIAKVLLNGQVETVHVKNTGRCKELLINGVNVYLSKESNPNRKTKYDLIAVEKGRRIINIDSQIPNDVVAEWLPMSGFFSENAKIKREAVYKKSRFDFYIVDGNRKAYLEVKGVTLEKNGVALFPDAPTIRGIKHLYELCDAINDGCEAYVIFVIQMKDVDFFTPNIETHPQFANALKNARDKGVKILCYDCDVTPDYIKISNPIDLRL